MSAKKKTLIKFGKIEIPIADGTSAYVPQNGGTFTDHGEILKTLGIAIRDNMPVLIVGESGTGKTSAIRYLASETKNGLRRVNLTGGTTSDELVGRQMINDKGTYWVDGILTEAMRNGDWIVLDEINAALPEVLFVLQSVMDDDGYLVLIEKDDKEIVHKHPNFRIFATCNPPEYAGTKEMNKALLSRFAICINADFPPEAKELEIIANRLGNAVAGTEMAVRLVKLANDTRKSKENGSADYAINTRDVLNILQLAENMDPMDALTIGFANKLDKEDTKALRTMAKLHLPQNKKAANAIKKQVMTIDDLNIGNTYFMNADVHNAYFGLTDDQKAFEELIKNGPAYVILNGAIGAAIKGDEFEIEGTYYDQKEGGVSKMPEQNMGDKIASAIRIIAGPNKGKMAVMPHHKALEDSDQIIKSILELT